MKVFAAAILSLGLIASLGIFFFKKISLSNTASKRVKPIGFNALREPPPPTPWDRQLDQAHRTLDFSSLTGKSIRLLAANEVSKAPAESSPPKLITGEDAPVSEARVPPPKQKGALNATGHFNRAKKLFAKGDYKASEADYRKALELNSHLFQARHNLGRLYLEQKRYQEAEIQFGEALGINPESAEVYGGLGDLYSLQGNHHKAEKRYREAIRLKPDFAEAYHRLGLMFSALGQLDKGEAEFRQATEKDPDNASYHYNFGTNLSRQKKPKQAKAEFLKAASLDPDLADAHNNLGAIYAAEGDYKKAKQAFKRTLRLRPKDSKARLNLANLYFYAFRDFNNAEKAYREVLKLEPRTQLAKNNLTFIREEQKRAQKAEKEFEESLAAEEDLFIPEEELPDDFTGFPFVEPSP